MYCEAWGMDVNEDPDWASESWFFPMNEYLSIGEKLQQLKGEERVQFIKEREEKTEKVMQVS